MTKSAIARIHQRIDQYLEGLNIGGEEWEQKYGQLLDGFGKWVEFEEYAKQNNKNGLTDKWQKFFKKVLNGVQIKKYRKGTNFYHAKSGCEKDNKNNAQKPWSWEKLEESFKYIGRANFAGIEHFYLARQYITAIAETRPELGEYVSFGKYLLVKGIKLADVRALSKSGNPFVAGFCMGLEYGFSVPVTGDRKEIDYCPTAYISQEFKTKNFDGIFYSSSRYEGGQNIVLFDSNKIKRAGEDERYLREIVKVSYKCREPAIKWKNE